MTVSARPDSFELGDYVGVLRRRGWIALLVALLGGLGAAAYVHVTPKTYIASSAVYVNVNAANATSIANTRTSGAQVNMDNEAAIVESTSVAAQAAHALHNGISPDRLVKQVTVAVPPNTSILQVNCSAATAVRAAGCAQAFANAYLSTRQGNAQNKIAQEAAALDAKEASAVTQSIDLRSEIKKLPADSVKLAKAQATLHEVNSELAALSRSISALSSSTNYNPGYIITPAVPPAAPSNPRQLLYVPSGLFAGLLFGLILAFAIDRRDDRIHSARDVERFLDLPVLFSLPNRKLGPQVSIPSPRSNVGRAFADLAQAVAAGLGEGNHVIVVAGASPGPGGSIVAGNLAATLARTRSNVILVCADLGDDVMPELLGLDEGRGLAEVLAGTVEVITVARRPADIPRLRVITPGIDRTKALGFLRYDALRQLVADLRRHAGYVVIAAQATGDGSETFSIAEFADAAVVVAQVDNTTKAVIVNSVTRLDRMRTPVLGAAVLPPRRRRSHDIRAKGRPDLHARPDISRDKLPQPPGRRHVPANDAAPRTLTASKLSSTATAVRDGETRPMPRVSIPAAPDTGLKPTDDVADKADGGN